MRPGMFKLAMPCALIDEPEEDHKSRPGAIPLVHRVWVVRLVLSQTLKQPVHGVVVDEDLVRREQVAVLGVQNEDETKQDREQTGIDLVRVVA